MDKMVRNYDRLTDFGNRVDVSALRERLDDWTLSDGFFDRELIVEKLDRVQATLDEVEQSFDSTDKWIDRPKHNLMSDLISMNDVPASTSFTEVDDIALFPSMLTPPLMPADEQRFIIELIARNRLNGHISASGLASKNPDLQTIVDLYFESTSPNTTPLRISSDGIKNAGTTSFALETITAELISAVAVNFTSLPGIDKLPGLGESISHSTTIGQLVSNLGLSDDLISVNNLSDDFYTELWKYENIRTVGGLLIGGVGAGGGPPDNVPFRLDTRIIDPNSSIDILIEGGGFVELQANYSVKIEDTFDFEPGGGGYDEGYDEISLVTLAVETLASLEGSVIDCYEKHFL